MNETEIGKLVDLLIATQRAHHEHQERDLGGRYSYEWPTWYADYLLAHGLPELLGRPLEKEGLARFLADAEKRHRAEDPDQKWSVFYAQRMAEWE
ncbi:MAG TPA: hypothetical protein VMN57_13485 [Anaerolineales bacterium]|nr:hypothetical protein [Anaerolineales bacterium]